MSLIIIIGFALAVFYHYYLGAYIGLGYPQNTFLFKPEDHFNDFRNALRCIDHSLGGPPGDPQMRDPMWKLGWPFITLVHYPFLPMGLRWGTLLWLGLFVGVFLAWCFANLRGSSAAATWRNAFVFSFLTYPFLFALDRANAEALIFIFLAVFFYCYGTPRHRLGLIALAAAVGLKAMPGVYIVLLLCDRRWRASLFVGALAIYLNLMSAAILPGGFFYNIDRSLFKTTDFYQIRMVLGNEGLVFGNSLWGVGKELLGGAHLMGYRGWPMQVSFAKLQLFYALLSLAAFALVTLYVFFVEKVLWKRVALLAFSMILLPYVSADYRLLHIYFPLFMFINSEHKGRFSTFYAVTFALLLIPKGYIYLPLVREATIQIILNPLLMVCMSLVIMWEGLVKSRGEIKEADDSPPAIGSLCPDSYTGTTLESSL